MGIGDPGFLQGERALGCRNSARSRATYLGCPAEVGAGSSQGYLVPSCAA